MCLPIFKGCCHSTAIRKKKKKSIKTKNATATAECASWLMTHRKVNYLDNLVSNQAANGTDTLFLLLKKEERFTIYTESCSQFYFIGFVRTTLFGLLCGYILSH